MLIFWFNSIFLTSRCVLSSTYAITHCVFNQTLIQRETKLHQVNCRVKPVRMEEWSKPEIVNVF